MNAPLPHDQTLDRQGFVQGAMRRTDRTLRKVGVKIEEFSQSVRDDFDMDLECEGLTPAERTEIERACANSLAQVICNSITEEQRQALFSFLKGQQ